MPASPHAPPSPSLSARSSARRRRLKQVSLGLLALFYVAAGIRHFTHPGFYVSIVPPVLPFALALVYLSGVAEIVLGLAVLVPSAVVLFLRKTTE
jgi:uncharacterized membrane protein